MIFDFNYINDKAAIDKSSVNDLSTLSKKRNFGSAGSNVHEVQYRTEVARCNAYGLLSTAAQPASL